MINDCKPRIAIPIPTSFDADYNQRSWKAYAAAVEGCGGEAVEIGLNASPAAVAELVNSCQGVLLPGSPADVNPHKFGQEPVEASAPPDQARENVDELLIQDAHNLYKPLLAICFGCQMLNVWRGGTLLQDLTPLPVNHQAGRSVMVAHSVAVDPATALAAHLTPEEAPQHDGYLRLPVNSSHHQAIGIPGDGLRVSARCPQDGVIEAVEGGQAHDDHQHHFVMGIQWHPERTLDQSPASRAIFRSFVSAAVGWTPRVIQTSVA